MFLLSQRNKTMSMHVFASKETMCFAHVLSMHVFNLLQNDVNKPWGYHLLCLSSLGMPLCTVHVCSFLFDHIKSYFL